MADLVLELVVEPVWFVVELLLEWIAGAFVGRPFSGETR